MCLSAYTRSSGVFEAICSEFGIESTGFGNGESEDVAYVGYV